MAQTTLPQLLTIWQGCASPSDIILATLEPAQWGGIPGYLLHPCQLTLQVLPGAYFPFQFSFSAAG